ncbi:hypothetical protein NEHOM01_2529, partial [Nematocida homosporus]|uniref:uncharacterized protein n=1 Tax=Nematocida homosporus TaxID=1912981 RepID=UPI00221FD396
MPSVLESRELHQSQLRGSSGLRRLLYKCPIVAFGVVLYFMYILTVGEKIFPEDLSFGGVSAKQASTLLFVAGCLISQVCFFAFSSFNIGLLSSPISESFMGVRSLAASLQTGVESAELFPTMFCCLCLTALLTSGTFLLMYFCRAERLFRTIPTLVSNALFIVIGIQCIRYANERVTSVALPISPWTICLLFNGLGLALCAFFFFNKKHYPVVTKYSILIIAAAGTVLFYAAKMAMGLSLSDVVANGWLQTDPRVSVTFQLPAFAFSQINRAAVVQHLPNIVGLVLLNVLQFPINLPPTVSQTKAYASPRQELLANSLCNAATSVVGMSSYLLPSSIMAVRQAGSSSRVDTLLISAGLCVAFLLSYRHFFYIPFIVFDLILLFLGGNIVLNTLAAVLQEGASHLPFVLAVTAFALFMDSILWGALAAIVLYGTQKGLRRVAHRLMPSTAST